MGGGLNYRQQVLDEICLEGLSGITLQVAIPTPASFLVQVDCLFLKGLWVRLSARPGYKLGLEATAKLFIWELVHCLPQVATGNTF